MGKTITCVACGNSFEYSGKGRPSTVCSEQCRALRKVSSDRNRYYQKREQILEQKREYHIANAERIAEKDRRYHRENRDKRLAYNKDYRQRNYDKVIAREREYTEKNRRQRAEATRQRVRKLASRTDKEVALAMADEHPGGEKLCRFGHWVSVDNFHRDRTRRDGLDPDCIDHANSYRRLLVDSQWNLEACFYCGSTSESIHIDHVVALANGGLNDARNLVPACASCNQSKWKTPVADWFERRFQRSFEAGKHPHAEWLSVTFPGLYPALQKGDHAENHSASRCAEAAH